MSGESITHRLRAGLATIGAVWVAGITLAVPPGAAGPSPAVDAAVAASRDTGESRRFAAVEPGVAVMLPRDHGSHPAYRTEWWYVTGWLRTAAGEPLGFQVTFFRSRPATAAADNPSAFAPHQVIIAHAAISDAGRGRLWHDQRVARAGFGLAGAAEQDLRVWLDHWYLERREGRFGTRIEAGDFALDLEFAGTQPPLLQGEEGFSRKGAAPESASYYYSLPQLHVTGLVRRGTRAERVSGTAWLDHEWSSEYLEPAASGWDWIGLNLDDGGALMAFRIRDRRQRTLWAGGTLRTADGRRRVFVPTEVIFEPGRRWRSPRTGVEYPVEWTVRAGDLAIALRPLMDDQESDARRSTGALYWEGAVTAERGGRPVGRGYLELTGYGEALRMR